MVTDYVAAHSAFGVADASPHWASRGLAGRDSQAGSVSERVLGVALSPSSVADHGAKDLRSVGSEVSENDQHSVWAIGAECGVDWEGTRRIRPGEVGDGAERCGARQRETGDG